MQISSYVKAATPFLWLRTNEYESAISDVKEEMAAVVARGADGKAVRLDSLYQFYRWDVADGYRELGKSGAKAGAQTGPNEPLDKIKSVTKRTVLFLLDYHKFIERDAIWRAMLNMYGSLRSRGVTIIIVSPIVKIPPEIANYIVVENYAYPNREWLKACVESVAGEFACGIDDLEKIINAGQGLSREEFRQALALSYTDSTDHAIHYDYVHTVKEQRIAKEGLVAILPSETGFDTIIGLDQLKSFTKRMIESGQGRGAMLLGVPGSGKSAFAATLGYETKRPTISLDFGTLMGGIVGESESKTQRALQLIDAMQPCVLFIDEIEKGLAGTSGYNGDSGTSRRQGSLFLKWLSDHKTNVYVLATANSISELPPEFKRAERWDATFFVDIPHEKQGRGILEYYAEQFGITDDLSGVDVAGLTGAEIKATCRIAGANPPIPFDEARRYICPIAKSMDIERLRAEAAECAVSADTEYMNFAEPPPTMRGVLS